jgi:flagellar protein FlaI
LVLIQQAVHQEGETLRRALSLTELERYYEPDDTIIQREVLSWDPAKDEHNFRGMYNSYILEEKIAKQLGYADTRKIYDVLKKRARIIQAMIDNNIYDYYEVWDMLKRFNRGGVDALPFEVPS